MPLKNWCSIHSRWPKAVWSIPCVSVGGFRSLKQNFIAYRSSKVLDCIFEIHQRWQSGFSMVYSNFYCSCSFWSEIIKIGQSSYKMYSNNILKFQESKTILNPCTKKVWKLIEYTTYTNSEQYRVCIYGKKYRTFVLNFALVHTHTHKNTHTHTYTNTHTHTHTHTQTHAHTQTHNTHTHTHTHTYTHTQTHTHTHTYTNTHTHTHTQTHIHTHTHIHKHTHTHTHTHIRANT